MSQSIVPLLKIRNYLLLLHHFSRKLDSTLFAAESFEDLSNELVLNNIDGESSSRLQSASESSDAIYNDGGLCFCIVLHGSKNEVAW